MQKCIYFTAIILLIILADSCTIHKRHYAKGFYIQLHPFHHTAHHLKGENNFPKKNEKIEINEILTESDTTQKKSVSSTNLQSPNQSRKVKRTESPFKATANSIPQTELDQVVLDHIQPAETKMGSATFLKQLPHIIFGRATTVVTLFLSTGISSYLASSNKEKYNTTPYTILFFTSGLLILLFTFLYLYLDIGIFLYLSGMFFMVAGASLAISLILDIINARINRENEHNNRVEEIQNESKSTPITEPLKPTDPTPVPPSNENLDLKLAWLNADEAVQKKNRQIIKLCFALPFIYLIAVSSDATFFIALFLIALLTLILLIVLRIKKEGQRKKALRNLENTTSPSGN